MPLKPPSDCEHCCHPIEGIAYATPDEGDDDAPWVRVCHPDSSEEFPDCYRAITVYGHPASRCRDCIDRRVHAEAGLYRRVMTALELRP